MIVVFYSKIFYWYKEVFSMKRNIFVVTSVLLTTLVLTGCSGISLGLNEPQTVVGQLQATTPMAQTTQVAPNLTLPSNGALPVSGDPFASMEGALVGVYDQVNPSVVHIRVIQSQTVNSQRFPNNQIPGLPFQFPNSPNLPTPRQEGLASGFVWDQKGDIVTNNHVTEGAERITVTFSDGTTVDGKVIGADPDSDLAVVKVDMSSEQLHPVQLADSSQLKVGQIAIAIGNPFGLDGTMTVGIVSALERSLPADLESTQNSPSYTIPDIIQTDAPINPGNSGGVLVNTDSQVIGVTNAIESSAGTSAGIGFAIPSNIVNKVVPSLIEKGSYEHPWLGISGITLNPDLAVASGLKKEQRGVLVVEVVKDGPSDKAGLHGSNRSAELDGKTVQVGGDVIVAIDSQSVLEFEDIVAYLARSSVVGQKINLRVLRDGKEQDVAVALAARPKSELKVQTPQETSKTGSVWLGIMGVTITPEINSAINLPETQTGVLVEQVVQGSPAEKAGLLGSDKPVIVNGTTIMTGGDVIIKMDDKTITTIEELKEAIQQSKSGQEVVLTVLRQGKEVQVKVVFSENPNP
jgi:serine protease Do